MIPLFRPSLPSPEEWLPYYAESLRTGQLTNFGPNHKRVERHLDMAYPGYHLPVSNGTVALEVALLTVCKPGDRIAVPDFTFAATINAVLRAGMRPVIFPCGADREMDTEVMVSNSVQFDAAIFVAPFGYKIRQTQGLEQIRVKNRKPIIFDLAGAWPMHFPIPSSVACYSLHAAKSLPIGEGGLICFPFRLQRKDARKLIAFGLDEKKVAHSPLGLNGKLDDLHCSILLAQLNRKNEIRERIMARRSLILRYEEALGSSCIPIGDPGGYPSLCVLKVPDPEAVMARGEKEGIVFRRYYHPLLTAHPAFSKFGVGMESHRSLSQYLAFPSDVTDEEFERVVACAKAS